MVVITVELWPRGDKSRRRLLGTGAIANDGTSTNLVGSYIANFSITDGKKWSRDSTVKRYPKQSLNVWHLIQRALEGALK